MEAIYTEKRARTQAGEKVVDLLLKSLQGAELAQEKPQVATRYSCNDGSWIAFKDKTDEELDLIDLMVNIIRNSGSKLITENPAVRDGDSFIYTIPIDTTKEALFATIKKLKLESAGNKKEKTCALALAYMNKLIAPPLINFSVNTDTDWLDASDIKALWEIGDQLDLFADTTLANVPLFTLGDRIGATEPLSQDSTADDKDFKQLQEALRRDDGNAKAILVLYLKKHCSNESSWFPFSSWFSSTPKFNGVRSEAEIIAAETRASSKGHWVSMVVNKVGRDIQFLLADSGNNNNLLDVERIHEAKALLLGPDYAVTNTTIPQTTFEATWPTIKIVLIIAVVVIICLIIKKQDADAKKKKPASGKAQSENPAPSSSAQSPDKKSE